LSIAVPFIEDGLASDRSGWAEMDHSHIDLVIVTQRATDGWKAWSDLREFPWRSALICRCENLHAKVYAFRLKQSSGDLPCWIAQSHPERI